MDKDNASLQKALEDHGFSWEEYKRYKETGSGLIYDDRILIDRIENEIRYHKKVS